MLDIVVLNPATYYILECKHTLSLDLAFLSVLNKVYFELFEEFWIACF